MKFGKYKHYKGNIYTAFNIAKHSETMEDLVLYKSEKDNQVWARPKEMFL